MFHLLTSYLTLAQDQIKEKDLKDMPWCPNCKTEYRNGFFVCHDCNVELVNQLPYKDKPESITGESSMGKEDIIYHFDEETYLITAVDNNQANLIESLLKSYNIPVLKKFRGVGHYLQLYWGFTVFGIDLYVPSLLLATAQDILNNQPEEIENEIEGESETLEVEQFQNNYQKDRRIKGWVIIASNFGFGLIALLGYGLYKLFNIKKNHE